MVGGRAMPLLGLTRLTRCSRLPLGVPDSSRSTNRFQIQRFRLNDPFNDWIENIPKMARMALQFQPSPHAALAQSLHSRQTVRTERSQDLTVSIRRNVMSYGRNQANDWIEAPAVHGPNLNVSRASASTTPGPKETSPSHCTMLHAISWTSRRDV